MKKSRENLFWGICLLAAFALWTCLVLAVDVQAIGPRDSAVGFATLNRLFHQLTGVHMTLYTVTDWGGLIPVAVALGFAILGLVQWIRRKKIWLVDRSILLLGLFYIAVIAVYLFFERVVINYRPVLIEGYLEASYPSSTTLLVMCVMPTAMMQCHTRIHRRAVRLCVNLAIAAFIAFMVLGRLFSGVHWLTDIVGGALVSAGLVPVYAWGAGIRP